MGVFRVDERNRNLIKNGVAARHRSMFIIVGDKWIDRIVDLHYMLSKEVVKAQLKVLWSYKDKLELSSQKKKRVKQIKKLKQRGLVDRDQIDPLSQFLDTGVTFCKYEDSERILGKSFCMCILQDFEALTPSLLARTIETVEGGGLIILLIRSLSLFTSPCTMVKDVHERFRPESDSQAMGRFNERLLLSIGFNEACLVLDDEFNILPVKSISPTPVQEDSEGLTEAEKNLENLKDQLCDSFPLGPLIKRCCTLDQGNAVLTLLDSVLDETLCSTIALVGACGRGKSSALGLAIAGAVAAGKCNIFVTSPSPENVKTLFEFVCKGLDVLDYKEHLDYDVVKSTNPKFKSSNVRINIQKHHQQKIQYIQPNDLKKLRDNKLHDIELLGIELLVVDEAAAIPLPLLTSLLGSYHVFLSTTLNGSEGSGRSLSLKLLQHLEQNQLSKTVKGAHSGRIFKRIELGESIRYASADPIESWLHGLLCSDVTNSVPKINRLLSPNECSLYYVNRDTLFSCIEKSESFLKQMMALYTASHYKDSLDDLQTMADSPAHQLFVLLGPVDESTNDLPDILCVVQVALVGENSREYAIRGLGDGHLPSGDQTYWKFCQKIQDAEFPSLSGALIVRIATHPSVMRLGYGSTAIEHLARYFGGEMTLMSEVNEEDACEQIRVTDAAEKVSSMEENIKARKNLPPLLVHLKDRRPEKLHYFGVSFGLTGDLFRFWRKHKFGLVHVERYPSNVTGEHTCMALKVLNSGSDDWDFLGPFFQRYKKRLVKFLGTRFCCMEHELAMSVLDPIIEFNKDNNDALSSLNEHLNSPGEVLSPDNMKILESYTTNDLGDFEIEDVVQDLARSYFLEKIPVSLSYSEASVLLCMGLQGKDISTVQGEMKLERQQILCYFNKVMKKFYEYLYTVVSKQTDSTLPQRKVITMAPHSITIDEDLDESSKAVQDCLNARRNELLNQDGFQEHAIEDREADHEEALQKHRRGSGGVHSSVSIASKGTENHGKRGKKRKKEENGSKSFKKRKNQWWH